MAPAGANLAEGVARRVLVRARAGVRLSAVLAQVLAARGGDCGAVALAPLAPRFGIERVEVRQALAGAGVKRRSTAGGRPKRAAPDTESLMGQWLRGPWSMIWNTRKVAAAHAQPLRVISHWRAYCPSIPKGDTMVCNLSPNPMCMALGRTSDGRRVRSTRRHYHLHPDGLVDAQCERLRIMRQGGAHMGVPKPSI